VGVSDSAVLCGGADRTGEHFNDVAVFDAAGSSLIACLPLTTGCTMPKMGGHVAVPVCFHNHAPSEHRERQLVSLLFGGINFVEERVFNDVFELVVSSDTASGSAGASRYACLRATCSGIVPEGRTGHTLTPLPLVLLDGAHIPGTGGLSQLRCFLLFGGSSPIDGVMNDLQLLVAVPTGDCSKDAASDVAGAVAAPVAAADGADIPICGSASAPTAASRSDGPAVCPPATAAAPAARYHLHWHQLPTKGPAPTPREMHSSFIRPGVQHLYEGGACTAETEARKPLLMLAAAFQEGVRAALSAAAASRAGSADGSGVTVTSPGVAVAAASPPSAAAPVAGCEPPALVVLGGRNEDGGPQMDGCILDLSTLTWQRPARIPHAVISAASGTIPVGVLPGSQGSGVSAAMTAGVDSAAADDPSTVAATAEPIHAAPATAPCFACAGGFQHFVFGGWDGAAGLSDKLLMLDTRPAAASVPCAAKGAAGSSAAAAAKASPVESSGLPCAPPSAAVPSAGSSCASTATSSGPRALSSDGGTAAASATAVVEPSLPLDVTAWFRSWATLPLRSSPAPHARFAAAAALVQTTSAAGSASTWSLLVFGGMTAERDMSEALLIDLPPARS